MIQKQPHIPAVRRDNTPQMVWNPGAMPQAEPDDVDLRSHVAMLYRRRWLILAMMSVVFALGMLYTITRRPLYESVAKILVFSGKQGVTSSDSELPGIRNLEAITGSRSIDTQIEIIASPDLLESAFARLNPSIRSSGFASDTIPDWACRVSQSKDADVIAISVRAFTPKAAAVLARSVAASYFAQDLDLSNRATRRARIYTEGKMAKAQSDLAKAHAALALYKRESGLFAPDTQFTRQAEQMADLSASIDTTRAEIASRRRENAALLKRISAEQKNVLTNTTVTLNPQYSAALDRIDKLQSDRAALLQEYTPGSRDIKDIDDRIAREESRFKKIAATVVGSKVSARNPIRDTLLTQYVTGVASQAAAAARLNALKSESQTYGKAARVLPERERRLVEYEERVATIQKTYEMLSTKYHTLVFNEQSLLPSGRLIVSPHIPTSPSYPKTQSNMVFFLLLGIFAGLVTAVIAEGLDMRVHEPGMAEQMTGSAALSVVPEMSRTSNRLLENTSDKPVLLESFRILRNNLAFAGLDDGMKTLAVTSPGRGEGKSTTTVNLAFAMAMEGTRVLVVDGDMRHPSLHKLLGIKSDVGLSTLLQGSNSVDEVIQSTSVENIYCIPAGPIPVNAAELLRSDASSRLFEDLKQQYDTVLIDCPPAAGLSDAQVISTLADGVLLVVSMNRTLRSDLDSTIRMMTYSGAPLVGLVINRADVFQGGHAYFYGAYGDTGAS